MAAETYKYFLIEAHELLERLTQGVLALEKGSSDLQMIAGLVVELLRSAHTLKGAARVVKQREIAENAHSIEEILGPFRESPPSQLPRDECNSLLSLLDTIGKNLAGLSSTAEPDRRSQPSERVRFVRADASEMSELLEGVTEVRSRIHELKNTFGLPDRIQQNLGMAERELQQLREGIENLRLVSVNLLFTALERTARDIAQNQQKHVRFEAEGPDIRLESSLLNHLQDALVQLVRNAVAHGIELGVERARMGKEASGVVSVQVRRRGRGAVFIVRDDGAGVDLESLRRVAQEKGILSGKMREMGSGDLLIALLGSGISTAGETTEASGRGVGLDVVRDAMRAMRAELSVQTEPGKGTTMELSVPLNLASIEVLVVVCGARSAAFPLDAVADTISLSESEPVFGESGKCILYDGRPIPLVELYPALDSIGDPRLAKARTAVIVQRGEGAVAWAVDQLIGTSPILMRPVPELAPASSSVAGIFLDAAGQPQIVLDPENIEIAAQVASEDESPEQGDTVAPILIIDDSLTTRMLEASILESAGYSVDLAVSAEDGLAKAATGKYSLFLVDVEMPGMDGFSFVERIQNDPKLRETPAVLVTSRSNAEDLKRGRDVGAKEYIIKGEFNQSVFLRHIKKYTGS